MLKTHNCGELRLEHSGQLVTLAGWVHRRRDHGGLIFIDMRDRSGLVQVVFNPEVAPGAHPTATSFRNEYVVQVKGKVSPRPSGTVNPNLPTGEIEVLAESTVIFNTSKTPPFYINEDVEIDETLRLKYRYLDIRRPHVKDNMMLRHRIIQFLRNFMDKKGFIEVETPILIKSTPEGARDYLVPSRLQPGKFYALPQSPQQLKQLLMVAGIEKYYQIARCFRDEDLRADRQPEFTQLDIEMSFITEEDILSLLEEMFISLVREVKPEYKMIIPFPRLRYADVMERYGNDKPDIRFGLELRDLSDILAKSEFVVFKTALEKGGKVKGICLPGGADYPRKQLDELGDIAKSGGAKGLITIALSKDMPGLDKLTLDSIKSSAAKFLTVEQVKQMAQRLDAKAGDLLLIVADNVNTANKSLSELRMTLGRRLKLADPDLLAFAFVVDFPMFEWSQELGHWEPVHHPFTSPREEDMPLIDTDPGKVRARHYDIVCNGSELSSGSIRIHTPELQRKIFRMLGYNDDEIQDRFGHMLEAFEYGAPPHGGIAPGIDRLVMILAGETNIREVIPFPKTQTATDLLTNAPSSVPDAALRDLHIKIRED